MKKIFTKNFDVNNWTDSSGITGDSFPIKILLSDGKIIDLKPYDSNLYIPKEAYENENFKRTRAGYWHYGHGIKVKYNNNVFTHEGVYYAASGTITLEIYYPKDAVLIFEDNPEALKEAQKQLQRIKQSSKN